MKAVFVHTHIVLRDSHIEPDSPPETWRLMPATLEAMRLLMQDDTLVFLYGPCQHTPDDGSEMMDAAQETLVKQIQAGGARVDGVLSCAHADGEACRCWGDFPGLLWRPAAQFNITLEESFVLSDEERDVATAYAAGARPIMVLGSRSIGEVMDSLPAHKDFPIAPDLTTAVGYIGVEQEINEQLGHPRTAAPRIPTEQALFAEADALPEIRITSRVAQGLQARALDTRAQLRDIGRWLSFLVMGALGLSLGIAYMLTHLYRMQPFPDFVYYVTLQFIPRPLRGALFIAWGLVIIFITIRSFYRSMRPQSPQP
jgi:hypothetical protein